MAITSTGHSKMKTWLKGFIKEGQYTLNGVKYKTPIYRTDITGDVITFMLYLDDSVTGTITRFELLDQDGASFDDTPDSINKKGISGLLVEFKYTLKKV
ncbi:hypothetical protein V7079_22805 [Priestia megaterium]|uniref:Uncharacterized protein n=1 Tax=Priestia aryabhattai TaxID=412384 RepID=A0ABD7X2C5_PRIAR|nr:hypothetical protein [Priestia aryabhattai]WEA46800.1 hypothetical protein PWO00_12810 [Priestia aryabhattai]